MAQPAIARLMLPLILGFDLTLQPTCLIHLNFLNSVDLDLVQAEFQSFRHDQTVVWTIRSSNSKLNVSLFSPFFSYSTCTLTIFLYPKLLEESILATTITRNPLSYHKEANFLLVIHHNHEFKAVSSFVTRIKELLLKYRVSCSVSLSFRFSFAKQSTFSIQTNHPPAAGGLLVSYLPGRYRNCPFKPFPVLRLPDGNQLSVYYQTIQCQSAVFFAYAMACAHNLTLAFVEERPFPKEEIIHEAFFNVKYYLTGNPTDNEVANSIVHLDGEHLYIVYCAEEDERNQHFCLEIWVSPFELDVWLLIVLFVLGCSLLLKIRVSSSFKPRKVRNIQLKREFALKLIKDLIRIYVHLAQD
jgi:hypothetical protein